MPQRIWVEDIGEYAEFPDGMSRQEMERHLIDLINSRKKQSDSGVDYLGAAKHGFKSGLADLIDSFADYSRVGSAVSPAGIINAIGQKLGAPDVSWGEKVLRKKIEEKAKQIKESADASFTPEGYQENVISGIASAPGTIAAMTFVAARYKMDQG